MDTGIPFPGVKRPGREADYSPLTTAEAKSAWSYTSAPAYPVMVWYLIKQRISFHVVVLS